MKTTITIKELSNLYNLNESVKGTKDYMKFHMQKDSKINNKWVYIGWGIPSSNIEAKVKKVKDKYYLIQNDERYVISPVVYELLI